MTLEAPSAKILELLLIEDSDTDFLLLDRKIHKWLPPSHVTRAANRDELIDALRRDYDLIITDFHLPGAEGEGLLNMIHAAQSSTPCLLLSGSSAELNTIAAPPTVLAKLEKGDSTGLRAALEKACLTIGVILKDN